MKNFLIELYFKNFSKLNFIFLTLFFFCFFVEYMVVRTHHHHGELQYYNKFGENFFTSDDFKFNEHVINTNRNKSYMTSSLYEDVEIGNLELRKLGRWVGLYLDYQLFYNVKNYFGNKFFFYFFCMFYSLLLSVSFLFIYKIIEIGNMIKNFKIFILSFLIFNLMSYLTIFQYYTPEFSYSIKETLFISVGIYAVLKKRFFLFLFIIVLAPLYRESGVIISFFWFIFYGKERYSFIFPSVSLFSYLLFNYDILSYILSYGFLFSAEIQPSQVTWSNVFTYGGELNFIRIFFINFIIYFMFTFIFIFTNNNVVEKKIVIILLSYLIIFLLFTTTSHFASKFLLTPFIIYLTISKIYQFQKND